MDDQPIRDVSQDYLVVFESPAGLRVLEDLERRFSDRASVVPGDPYGTHVNEGQRDVYRWILYMMRKAREPEPEEEPGVPEELRDPIQIEGA